MDLKVKHVFANAMCSGDETKYDIKNAYNGNGCPIRHKIGNINYNRDECSGNCEKCFDQPIEAIR